MTQPKRGRGRPGKNWEALFQEWLKSGLSKAAFLATKGMTYGGGAITRNTSDWDVRARALIDTAHVAVKSLEAEIVATAAKERKEGVAPTMAPPTVASATEGAKAAATAARLAGAAEVEIMAPVKKDSAWDLIQKWRGNQAVDDFKSADQIKNHIKIRLQRAMKVTKVIDEQTGEVQTTFVSELTPMAIRQYAEALASVQRIQRLALGLSTDNLGVDIPMPARPEGEKPQGPIFVVEMDGGKFKSPRPRRVS